MGFLFIIGVFIEGVRFGAYQFLLMDAAARASLIVFDLENVRSGKIERMIISRESELDGEILKAMEFQDYGFPMLFWPYSADFNHASYLQRVAKYRKIYPSLSTSHNDPEFQDIRNWIDANIKRLIQEYGTSSTVSNDN